MRHWLWPGLVLACLLLAPGAGAQTPASPDSLRADSLRAGPAPDLLLRARVQARELRVHTRDSAHVRVWACPHGDTLSATERGDLPRILEPGVTYRDVDIRVTIAAFLADSVPELAGTACLAPPAPGVRQRQPSPEPTGS